MSRIFSQTKDLHRNHLWRNCSYHNIIHIHKSVLWDWQYSMEYFPHSIWIWRIFHGIWWVPHNIVLDLNNVMTAKCVGSYIVLILWNIKICDPYFVTPAFEGGDHWTACVWLHNFVFGYKRLCRPGNDMEAAIMGGHGIKLKSMVTATNVIHTINNDGINNQMNGKNWPLHLFCLISVSHTNSQLPTLFWDYILEWPNVIFSVGFFRLYFWMRI